jgi:hypothetical protein
VRKLFYYTQNKKKLPQQLQRTPTSYFVSLSDKTLTLPLQSSSTGLKITYTIEDPSIATISGNIVTLLKSGNTNIIASDSGNINYYPLNAKLPLTIYESNYEYNCKVNQYFKSNSTINDFVIDKSGNVYSRLQTSILKWTPPTTNATFFAGSTTNGQTDGTGTAATFSNILGMSIDQNDNIYVLDVYKLRKITPSGVVTTIVDYTSLVNKLNPPTKLVQDSKGNTFIINEFKINKISSTGIITVFAGSTYGDVDGNGSNAMFNYPTSITIDQNDNLYVSEATKIKKITPNGDVTTVAGIFPPEPNSYSDGNLMLSTFNSIDRLSYDQTNNLLFVSSNNTYLKYLIRRIDFTNNNVSTYIGGGKNTSIFPTSGREFLINGIGNLININGQLYFSNGSLSILSTNPSKKTQSILDTKNIVIDFNSSEILLPGVASSGLPLTYTSSNGNILNITGNKATVKTAGYTTITVSQAGDVTYEAATNVTFGITVNPPIIKSSGSGNLCKNDSVILYAPKGFANYLWYPSGAKTDSILVKTQGNYYVLINNSKSNTISITQNSNPNITFNKLPSVIYTNSTPITLTGSPTGGSFSGVGVSGNTFSPFVGKLGKRLITYTYTGASCASTNMVTQEVNVIDTLGGICATYDTLYIKSKITVGVNSYDNTFKIYPNPVSDILMLENSQYLVMSGYKMQLVNTLGQVVYNANITQSIQSFNLSGLVKNAVYFVKLIDDKGTVLETKKIVLE